MDNWIAKKFIDVEREIHYDRTLAELEEFFGAFAMKGRYEDGIFAHKHHDFLNNSQFEHAYTLAIEQCTARQLDPHIRWRARIFEFFFKQKLGGRCVELGTGFGFLFYFALTKAELDGEDLSTTQVLLIDKFDDMFVDRTTGVSTGLTNQRYAPSSDYVLRSFARFSSVQVMQGVVPSVLSNVNLPEISFLHVDLNAALPEVEALEMLWPRLLPGAVVILDDYGFPDFVNSQEQHDALARKLGYEILALPTGQGLILKR
jgi:predicted O-methyltransferase YrrM